DEIYTLFAQRSHERWLTFLAGENRSRCFRRLGVLWLAYGSDPSILAARRIFERHNVTHEFLGGHAVRARCRDLEVPAGTVALFEPDSGALLAEEAVRAVAESATRNGARYVNARVKPPQSAPFLNSLKTESGQSIEADIFVFACGSWLPRLFPDVL